jgi:16S rRNA (cytosine1402-N4)-methyltransferase
MHEPVLLRETADLLAVVPGGVYVDATVGGGGHAAALLDRSGPGSFLLGVDRDEEALARAQSRLAATGRRFALRRGNFGDLERIVHEAGLGRVDGVLFDLGVSSDQIESAERGFSFLRDGPLDLRMDRGERLTAADLVNGLPEAELWRILRTLGEEPMAARIARAIVRAREREPIATTTALAEVVARSAGRRRSLHPATRTFQALRMAVNREAECLAEGLRQGLEVLAPGGRLAAISFHSLEDTAVKRFIAGHAGTHVSLPEGGREWRGERPAVLRITRKPVMPSADEALRNPRARSARLRVAERSE